MVYEKIIRHHTQQRAQISRYTSFQRMRVQVGHQSVFWSEGVRKVSYAAINEAVGQHQLAISMPADLSPCTESYMAIMGIPCCHTIKHMLSTGQKPQLYPFPSALVAATDTDINSECPGQ